MSKRLVMAGIPKSYWIIEGLFRCRKCRAEYSCRVPHSNELVKFVEDGGQEERWLPTFEPGGYLELMERLVPGFKKSDSITMPIAKGFEKEFKKLQERSDSGATFSVAVGCYCPQCGSRSADQVSQRILDTPELRWLKYETVL